MHIRNYNEKYLGRFESNDYYEEPILVKYIDNLIKGDTNVIEQIKNFKIKEDNKEEILLKQIQEELLKYKEEKELNKNQVSLELYKDKVLSCINYKEIDKLPIDVVLNAQNFLSCCSEKTIDSKLNKILKINK